MAFPVATKTDDVRVVLTQGTSPDPQLYRIGIAVPARYPPAFRVRVENAW